MNNGLVFFVDLDGTLKTEHDDFGPFEVSPLTVQSGFKHYVFAPRPHIQDFLIAAKKKGDVFLSTIGGGGYARRVLKAMGIENRFDRIIAAEEFRAGIRFYPNTIFIDNNREMATLKAQRMEGINKYALATYPEHMIRQDVWTIDTYLGTKDDKTMLELIEEIEKL